MAEEVVLGRVPILIEAILVLNKKFLIANSKCPGEGPLVQTDQLTAPRLSSPFNALADRVGRSGTYPPSIEARWVKIEVDFKIRLKLGLLLLLSGFVAERPPYEK